MKDNCPTTARTSGATTFGVVGTDMASRISYPLL
jgi:hypothetical protein